MNDIKLIVSATIFILLFGLVSTILPKGIPADAQTATGSWSCAADIFSCPDGSSVGRVPPYCHFASCPVAP